MDLLATAISTGSTIGTTWLNLGDPFWRWPVLLPGGRRLTRVYGQGYMCYELCYTRYNLCYTCAEKTWDIKRINLSVLGHCD